MLNGLKKINGCGVALLWFQLLRRWFKVGRAKLAGGPYLKN
jgi:hypothetical protein